MKKPKPTPVKAPERKLPPPKIMASQARYRALVEAALSAIEDLYCNTVVSQAQTRDDLREIADDIQIKIEALGGG